jgi:hypothetical protein
MNESISIENLNDRVQLVEAIRKKRHDNSDFLSIVNDIMLVMLSCVNFKVKLIRKHVNLVAHTLTRAANSLTSFY